MKHFFQELREDRRFLIFLLSLLAAAILAAGLMITVSKQTKSHRYEQQLQNGYGHLESQNYDQAISDFEAAYGLEQTDDAAVGLARAWFARGMRKRPFRSSPPAASSTAPPKKWTSC